MIIVVIGQSGAGKTSFVKNNFLQGEIEIISDIVPYTTNGNFCAVGKYGIGIRTEGTDTLPYNSGEKIRELAKKLHAAGKNILLEGDRINNRATFEFLSTLKADVKLFLVTCSLETSLARLKAVGSKITLPFVKGTKTRSRNNFLQYKDRFNGEIFLHDNAPATARIYQGYGRKILFYEMRKAIRLGLREITFRTKIAGAAVNFWQKMGARITGRKDSEWEMKLQF